MKRVYHKILVTASLLAFIPVLAISQDTLSLESAIKIGLENNFSILLSRNELQITKNNNTLGNAGMLPKVDVNSGLNSNIQSIEQTPMGGTSESSEKTTTTLSGSLQLNWTLFDGMAMFVSRKQLGVLSKMGELKYRMSIEDAVASIIVNYYSIVQQQKLIRNLEESFALSKERLKVTQEKSKIGVGYELQVIQAEIDFRADSSNLLRQVNYLKNLHVDLNNSLGRDPSIQFEVKPIEISIAMPNYENIISGLSTNNAELLYERLMVDNKNLSIKTLESSRYPKIGFVGSYNYSNMDFSSGTTEKSIAQGPYFGLTASITLFNGFNLNRNITNARIQLENQQISLNQKENTLKSLAIKYFNDYNLAFSLVRTEEIAMKLAHKNLTVAMEKYRLGAISDLELRDVQKKLLDTQYRYYSMLLQAKTAEVELKILAGIFLDEVSATDVK